MRNKSRCCVPAEHGRTPSRPKRDAWPVLNDVHARLHRAGGGGVGAAAAAAVGAEATGFHTTTATRRRRTSLREETQHTPLEATPSLYASLPAARAAGRSATQLVSGSMHAASCMAHGVCSCAVVRLTASWLRRWPDAFSWMGGTGVPRSHTDTLCCCVFMLCRPFRAAAGLCQQPHRPRRLRGQASGGGHRCAVPWPLKVHPKALLLIPAAVPITHMCHQAPCLLLNSENEAVLRADLPMYCCTGRYRRQRGLAVQSPWGRAARTVPPSPNHKMVGLAGLLRRHSTVTPAAAATVSCCSRLQLACCTGLS